MKGNIFLSICILTYNREEKLNNLFLNLKEQIGKSTYRDNIEIIIGDNCSTDGTKNVVEKNKKYFNNVNFQYFRHITNLGFDKNCDFLYRRATGEYVWFLSDNVILKEDALSEIYKNLSVYKPSGMLFSFIQGDTFSKDIPTFNIPTEVALVTDDEEAIDSIVKWPKVSIYIIEKMYLGSKEDALLDKYLDTGFRFLTLMLYVFLTSKEHSLLLYKEPLASAYSDCLNIRYSPRIFAGVKKASSLPYIVENYPHILSKMADRHDAEVIMIKMLMSDYLGKIKVDDTVRISDSLYFKKNTIKLLSNKKTRKPAFKFLILKIIPIPLKMKRLIFLVLKNIKYFYKKMIL